MWGMMENAKETLEVKRMSLEQAYQSFKAGNLRHVLAIYAAKYLECECGNAAGEHCFNSAHADMRREMNPPHQVDCFLCACVGCSEGNCCTH